MRARTVRFLLRWRFEERYRHRKKEDAMEQLRKMLHGFTEPEELSRELLFHFIDHIEIGQGSFRETEQGRIKEQTVRIYFRFGRDIS